jgi:hypothetical protein
MKCFRMARILMLSALLGASLFSFANASPISISSVMGSGSYNNNPNLLIDGNIPPEWTDWTAATNVWWYGTGSIFTLDFGSAYNLDDMLIQVDNNDSYGIQYSINGSNWNDLFSISSGAGNVSYGMDTFTQAEIAFTPVDARYVRVFATGGDNAYAISEIQAFGSQIVPGGEQPSPAPEPTSLILLGSGLLGIAGLLRKKS